MMSAPSSDWPRRLLHIPTMTSIERTHGNTYDDDVEPAFNIMSYTWGRWMIKGGGPALAVDGITWLVPAVLDSHFSVRQLTDIVTRVGQDVSYVWIDVACIDQETQEVKMDEVGKQAAIFDKAESGYVWLSQTSTIDLARYMVQLEATKRALERLPSSGLPGVLNTQWLDTTIELFQNILADPWFSSLWTLQEAWLRKDAILLSKEGESVSSNTRDEISVFDLAEYSSDVYREILNLTLTPTHPEPLDRDRAQRLLDLIRASGLPSLNSTNAVVLYPIARFRRTRHPLDRVYGIMQIYGLRLGESAQPGRSFTLDELETQLAAALNAKSPLYAQLLVHTKPSEPGKCWRVNPFSEAPSLANRIVKVTHECQITVSDAGRGVFHGRACGFGDPMVRMWREASVAGPVQEMLLDASEFAERHFPRWSKLLSANMDENQHSVAEKLVRLLGDRLIIALLGTGVQHRQGRMMPVSVGLLLVRHGQADEVYWQRIGICAWESEALQGREDMWFAFEGLLGAPQVATPKPARYFDIRAAAIALVLTGVVMFFAYSTWSVRGLRPTSH